jgi:DNA-nicking Smr family endonuclease
VTASKCGGDEILRYVERHGVRDKDALAQSGRPLTGSGRIARTRKGRFRKTIDLHGMISLDAERALSVAIDECKKSGITELLIIHGRGAHSNNAEVGVLKKLVQDSLECRYTAVIRSFGPALPRDGGEGATLARLL